MKNGIYSIKAETKVLNSMPPDNGWESKFAKHKNEYGKKNRYHYGILGNILI